MIPLYHCKGKRVYVVGLGKAGSAMLAALKAGGAEVIAWDDKPEARAEIEKSGYMTAEPEALDWSRVDLVVLSPGVPLYLPTPHPAAAMARRSGCEIVGEVELLYREFPANRYVGITGTNGKSTTTELVAHLLRLGGVKVEVGGNLGVPAVALDAPAADTVYVLEMSSYQLDLVATVRFQAAVLLNFSIDHQERHGSMAGYIKAKRRIFAGQQTSDIAIIGWDDKYSRDVLADMQQLKSARIAGIGKSGGDNEPDLSVRYNGNMLEVVANKNVAMSFDLTKAESLQGPHNGQNAAAAVAVALYFNIDAAIIQQGLQNFKGLPHRMELVAARRNVKFINDSKATNADAAEQALKSFNDIFWIAGGKPKEGDRLNPDIIKASVKKAYLIGEAEELFASQLEGVVPYQRCGNLAAAFAAAAAEADSGVVLLSPACASFDQWKNFEERGNAFRTLAEALP